MIVTLLTDFGMPDGYVAEVKGTLLRLAPGVILVDVTHDVPPGDVAAAAYVLGRVWHTFPEGTVHLAVVDPGVGTARRALAAASGGHRFVAPDNGLLSGVLARPSASVVAFVPSPGANPTFHGRDVFAPAAAALARGAALADLGREISDPVRLPRPKLVREGGDVAGQVVYVDRFGTLVTNIPASRIVQAASVRMGVYDLVLHTTFADVPVGDPVAFIGSGGTLEIAVRDGRADSALGASRGAEVRATCRRTTAREEAEGPED